MRSYISSGIVFLLFLLLWEVSGTLFHLPAWLFPAPLRVVQTLWEAKWLVLFHSIPTITEAIIGLLLAVCLGVCSSVIMHWSVFLKNALYPLLIISQSIPFIILAPLLTLWLGFGVVTKIIIVALVCFFPIAISLLNGFQSVDPAMIRLMTSMGATKWQLFKLVTIPASVPSFFSGLRVAAAYSILGAVISEWIGADRGLGIFLVRTTKSYLTDRAFAIVFVITGLSVLVMFIIECIARLFSPWQYQKKFSKGGSYDA